MIAGATAGGASFVVRPEIMIAADLRGRTVASPQLGGTQDVALRVWLKAQGLTASLEGPGDLTIAPQGNAQTLETFRSADIAGAWVPEPWATRLVVEGGGHVLVDERTLWPEGRFVSTLLAVRAEFLRDHPDVVGALLRGQIAANDWIAANSDAALRLVEDVLHKDTGTAIKPEVLAAAWPSLRFSSDPMPASLLKAANNAQSVGLLDLTDEDLRGLIDPGPLNAELRALGRAPISGAP